jgi:hypothetical protein
MLLALYWLIFITVTFASSVYSGFVLSELWGYFMVPLGVKALSIPNAIGIMLLITFLFRGTMWKVIDIYNKVHDLEGGDEKLKAAWTNWGAGLLGVTVLWGWGALVHSFM